MILHLKKLCVMAGAVDNLIALIEDGETLVSVNTDEKL